MQNLSSSDFFHPTHYNTETKNQLWMSVIADTHDAICNCNGPFAHLLASIFPPGHQDRNRTITEILQRDYKETCHSGGTEERNSGEADGVAAAATTGIKEEDTLEEDIDALMVAAAAATEEENTR